MEIPLKDCKWTISKNINNKSKNNKTIVKRINDKKK